VLPESAGILFGGGFPRNDNPTILRAVQRAIYFVQRELEATGDENGAAIVVCDRGTIDGEAYWPGPGDLWASVGTTREAELSRYDAVIHLSTPDPANGYGHSNPLRIESADQAHTIDDRILRAWADHTRRYIVEATHDFLAKAARAFAILRGELPECCRAHTPTGLLGGESPGELKE